MRRSWGGLVHQRVQLLVGLAVLIRNAEHVAVLVGVDHIVAVGIRRRTFGWVLLIPVAGVNRVARATWDAGLRVHNHLLMRWIVHPEDRLRPLNSRHE